MKAKLIPIVATLCAIAVLFTITFALKAGEDANAQRECMGALVRPSDPDEPGYGEAWISYSSDVKMCMGMP
jgi:hypothetical protein